MMLVLTRRVGEGIVIPPLDVSVDVINVKGRRARLGVSAPPEVPVHRKEVWSRINSQSEPRLDDLPIEGARILLADADDSFVAPHEAHLSRLGYEVAVAGDAISCVAFLRSTTPDVLVLDAGLLWGRAEGVLALMEEQDDVPPVSVLVWYDNAHPQALSTLRRLGVRGYVAKPLTPEQLAGRIRGLFQLNVGDS